MAENEAKLINNLAALPEPLQAEFLAQIQGAATAVKVMAETATTPAAAGASGGK